jgi:hypothetical protein
MFLHWVVCDSALPVYGLLLLILVCIMHYSGSSGIPVITGIPEFDLFFFGAEEIRCAELEGNYTPFD